MTKGIEKNPSLILLQTFWDAGYRRRFVHQALNYARKTPQAASVKRLKPIIDQHIKFHGFREASKALQGHYENICSAVESHLYLDGLLAALLPVWAESLPTFQKAASEVLIAHGIVPLEKLRGELKLADDPDNIDAAVAALQEAQSEIDNEDARVMVICMSGQFPYRSHVEDEASDTGTRWDHILRDLENYEPDEAEFDEGRPETFMAALQEMVDRKRAERNGRSKLKQALSNLQSVYLEQLRFIVGTTSAELWRAETIALASTAQLADEVVLLTTLLAEYRELNEWSVSSAIERRQRDAKLQGIEDTTTPLHAKLEFAFNQIATEPKSDEADGGNLSGQPASDITASGSEADTQLLHVDQQSSVSSEEVNVLPDQHERLLTAHDDIDMQKDLPTLELQAATQSSNNIYDTDLVTISAASNDQGTELLEQSDAHIASIYEGDSLVGTEDEADALVPIDFGSFDEIAAWTYHASNNFDTPPNENDAALSLEEGLSGEDSTSEIIRLDVIASTSADPTLVINTDSDDGIAASIARRLLDSEIQNQSAAIATLVSQLLLEERYSIAYYLTQCQEAQNGEQPVASALIRALALAPYIWYDIGNSATLLKQDYTAISERFETNTADSDALTLLTIAASLRPALLTPSTGAPSILQSIHATSGIQSLHAYCQIIAKYGQYQQPLDIAALHFVNNRAAWQQALTTLQSDIEAWGEQAPTRTFRYAPAGKVWQRWLKTSGPIGQLMTPVQQNDTSKLDQVRASFERLLDSDRFRHEVQHTDRAELGRRTGEEIVSSALNQLRQATLETIDLAKRWVQLQESRSTGKSNYLQAQAGQLRNAIMDTYPQVLNEFKAYEAQQLAPSTELLAAITLCRNALTNTYALFEQDAKVSTFEFAPRTLLNRSLLQSPDIVLDEEWEPIIVDQTLQHSLLTLLAEPTSDWPEAIDIWSERGDHKRTEQIITALNESGAEPSYIEALEIRRKRNLLESRAALDRDLDDTRRTVEAAVAYGLLREEERNNFIARIEQVELTKSNILRFTIEHVRLQAIRNETKAIQNKTVEQVRQRLALSEISNTDSRREQIEIVLDKGDVLAANEYIDMVLKDELLPQDKTDGSSFTKFFPNAVRELLRVLEDGNHDHIRQSVRELRERARGRVSGRNPIALFDQYDINGPRATEAATLLEAWFAVKSSRRLDVQNLERIITNLGFTFVSFQKREVGRIDQYLLETRTIQNKLLCPAYQYGSSARGRYRLLCAWDRPSENEILNTVAEQEYHEPTLVFYFGRMTEPRRKELARLCRERRITCVLIDDLLVTYLCTQPAPRLSSLFNCALPFTHLEPYTTTAGIVPTEVFYGRERERRQILDPLGSCFIYGGRQLGKTALLRDIERDMHQTDAGRIVIWIDLKAEGIGNERPIDAFWTVIARELRKVGVIPEKASQHASADRLLQHIQDWLEADLSRRILLLLDEADRFLDSDGQKVQNANGVRLDPFPRASQIKGLMDRTNRRFKVVFAGLHNVQRTTRASNHPLAHYGKPICIGPLLEEGEWRQARDLVEIPLASIGFRFASSDLVTRILSQTNYYPSLIQLYCKQLAKHLANVQGTIDGPPYTITARHVEEVYQDQSLRADIRQRFNLTIQLDQRYEVLAYAVAYGTLTDGGHGLADGFFVEWIREQALTWWQEGFESNSSEEQFLVLLDEMVGLGILRQVSKDKYSLRSPNVVLLMGTHEEIEKELLRSRELPIEYERETFRAALRNERTNSVDPLQRSPLTALQESELTARSNSVSIICGTKVAGREDLERFLSASIGAEYVHSLRFVDGRGRFGSSLDNLLKKRADNGTSIVLVTPGCLWSETWIDDALERLERLTSKTSFVHVAFVAEPATTWQLLTQAPVDTSNRLHHAAQTLTLRPWHDIAIRQWLEDCDFDPKLDRQKLKAITGNWPEMLKRFYNATRQNLRYWPEALGTLEQQLQQRSFQEEIKGAMELTPSPAIDVLQTMVQWNDGQMTVEDLIAVIGEESIDRILLSLRWADNMSFAYPLGNDTWRVDPIIKILLAETTR